MLSAIAQRIFTFSIAFTATDKLLLFDSKQRVKTQITGLLQFLKHLTEFSENIKKNIALFSKRVNGCILASGGHHT